MKIKLSCILIAAITALSLCACENVTDITGKNPDVTVSKEPSTDIESNNDDKEEPAPLVTDEASASFPEYLVCNTYSSLVLLNEDGTVKEKIDLNGEDVDFAKYAKGNIFYYGYEYSGESYYILNVKNVTTGEVTELKKSSVPISIDINGDSLIVICQDYVGNNYEETVYDLNTLAPTGTVNTYTFEGSSFVSFSNDNYNCKNSILSLKDKAGYIILCTENYKYVTLTDDVEENLPLLDNVSNICAYSKEGVLYTTYVSDSDYNIGALNFYDFASQKNTVVAGKEFYSFLCYDNGTAYYSIVKDDTFDLETYDIISFNLIDGSSAVVASAAKQPLGNTVIPGITNSVAKDGLFYYLDYCDGTLDWYVAKNGVSTPLNANIYTNPISEYGKVETISRTIKCPDCGETVLQYYSEYMVFDEDTFPAAKAINESIKEAAEASAEASCEMPTYLSEEFPCEEHGLYYSMETMEEWISEIIFLSDNLMTIDKTGYWYGGGAHGMPSVSHMLIDTNTGAPLSIQDLYNGTEEEFKKIVAEKTVEDFNSYGEETPYFAAWEENGEETVYNQAYEEASFTASSISFNKDGIVIEYPPYDMGPYAAGYINVNISYDELGIDLASYGK